jgi:hypothetical protein
MTRLGERWYIERQDGSVEEITDQVVAREESWGIFYEFLDDLFLSNGDSIRHEYEALSGCDEGSR